MTVSWKTVACKWIVIWRLQVARIQVPPICQHHDRQSTNIEQIVCPTLLLVHERSPTLRCLVRLVVLLLICHEESGSIRTLKEKIQTFSSPKVF